MIKMDKETMYEITRIALLDAETDIYWLVRLYNDLSDKFDLGLTFWVDGTEYWGDEEIYCYIYVDNVGSIIINWACDWYDNKDYYKELTDYLLYLDECWNETRDRIEVRK